MQNARYRAGFLLDVRPAGADRLGQECAWWLWTCWKGGLRKVDPAVLRWWVAAIGSMAASRELLTGTPVTSIAEFDPALVAREANRLFTAKNSRPPSPGGRRNLASIAEHSHLLVSVRCTDRAWWTHDVWSLQADDRIPRRPHEPAGANPVNLRLIDTRWLRDAVRFYLSSALTHGLFTWSTCTTRARTLAYLGTYLSEQGIAHPAIAVSSATLRTFFTGFTSWLRSPQASSRPTPLSAGSVATIESHVQSAYEFFLDTKEELAEATSDPRWLELREDHARLWTLKLRAPSGRDRPGARENDWIGATDMARMASCLEILSAPSAQKVTVTLPGGEEVSANGLADPQAARAWLLQALTGRRVSEILMLDYAPLSAIPGVDPVGAADDAFVARLRYQQTKVDGVDPTIFVDAAVVALIAEQQEWARAKVEEDDLPTYLFLAPRHNHRGLRPRPYGSHLAALRRLDQAVELRDALNNPLRFTSTHRLRHTRATELLNAGVPVHVVQRYLGHRSPAMTMHYAATLAQTAEAEFLKAKRVGAFGHDLALDPGDLYNMTAMASRAGRVLPNGLCLLPPAKTCDRGNACLTCGHFATDSSHLPDLLEQRHRTLELIDIRQEAFTARRGCPMPENNVWLAERTRELASLDAITAQLRASPGQLSRGAGITARTNPASPSPTDS